MWLLIFASSLTQISNCLFSKVRMATGQSCTRFYFKLTYSVYTLILSVSTNKVIFVVVVVVVVVVNFMIITCKQLLCWYCFPLQDFL